MFKITNIDNNHTNIEIVKGNTFRQRIRIINDERLNYIPSAGDQIMFVVKSKYSDDKSLFEKQIPYDSMMLELKAKETAKMKTGNYVYYIKLIRHNADADTFIYGSFRILDSI